MDYKGHLLVGYSVGLIFLAVMNLTLGWFSKDILSLVIYSLVIGLYCLLPDVDHPISTITWLFVGASVIGLAYGFFFDMNIVYYSFGLLCFTFICAQLFSHRGFIHSITFCTLASIPLFFIFGLPVACLGLASAYSHLAADGEWLKLV